MSNRELPMMPWYPDQFASATSQWTYAERSAYRALLDVQWALGVLDPDPQRLADSIRLPLDEFLKIWPMVRRKFSTVDGGIQNIRLEEHRLKAFALKQSRRAGAELTNAQRSGGRVAQRPAQRSANRIAQRDAQRHASATPLSPSPSGREEPTLPSTAEPVEGADLPGGYGRRGSRANGTNPRALGTNPRSLGTNPRALQNASLAAWREITPIIDDIANTGSLPPDQRRTWADIGKHCSNTSAVQAAESVGFRLIADRDKFTTTDLQTRFREAYERLQREQHQ